MNDIRQICTVSDEERALRLDVFVSGKYPSLSRSQVKKMIEDGEIRINGSVVSKAGLKLKAGDVVEFIIRPAQPWQVTAQDIPLQILYEDRHLLVINKPAGMVVHPRRATGKEPWSMRFSTIAVTFPV
mgnify:CR=1 FL=1